MWVWDVRVCNMKRGSDTMESTSSEWKQLVWIQNSKQLDEQRHNRRYETTAAAAAMTTTTTTLEESENKSPSNYVNVFCVHVIYLTWRKNNVFALSPREPLCYYTLCVATSFFVAFARVSPSVSPLLSIYRCLCCTTRNALGVLVVLFHYFPSFIWIAHCAVVRRWIYNIVFSGRL